MSDYELQRLSNIRRNKEELDRLGIEQIAEPTQKPAATKKAAKKRPKPAEAFTPRVGERSSKRVRQIPVAFEPLSWDGVQERSQAGRPAACPPRHDVD